MSESYINSLKIDNDDTLEQALKKLFELHNWQIQYSLPFLGSVAEEALVKDLNSKMENGVPDDFLK